MEHIYLPKITLNMNAKLTKNSKSTKITVQNLFGSRNYICTFNTFATTCSSYSKI